MNILGRYTAAFVVSHCTDAADRGSGNDDIPGFQRTILHQNSHDGTTALVQTGFDHGSAGSTVRIGLQFLHLGKDDKVFQQLINTETGFCGDRAHNGIAAPFFTDQVIFRQLLLDALGVGTLDIHLVDGNYNGNTGSFGMINAFNRLRHDAVIGGNNEDRNIRYHGATGTHGGKGLMTRCIEECDGAAVNLDSIGTDVLCDAAGFARCHIGMPDIVKQ